MIFKTYFEKFQTAYILSVQINLNEPFELGRSISFIFLIVTETTSDRILQFNLLKVDDQYHFRHHNKDAKNFIWNSKRFFVFKHFFYIPTAEIKVETLLTKFKSTILLWDFNAQDAKFSWNSKKVRSPVHNTKLSRLLVV